MNKLEYRVDAKIIKQISLYLMLHGINNYDLSVQSNTKDVSFILNIKNMKDEILTDMKDKLSRQRELEVEIYGWELLGDTDTQNQLDVLGSLIDEVKIEVDGENTKIIMRRNYPYKE
jgi:O-glycosyl hydrolase